MHVHSVSSGSICERCKTHICTFARTDRTIIVCLNGWHMSEVLVWIVRVFVECEIVVARGICDLFENYDRLYENHFWKMWLKFIIHIIFDSLTYEPFIFVIYNTHLNNINKNQNQWTILINILNIEFISMRNWLYLKTMTIQSLTNHFENTEIIHAGLEPK